MMKQMCCVAGCDKKRYNVGLGICEMHYFRLRRGGSYEKRRKIAYKYKESRGYYLLREPQHPLAQPNGYVYEHRFVLFNTLGANAILTCFNCAKPMTWQTCDVDHIDNDKSNNKPDNLRPSCGQCNRARGYVPAINLPHTKKATFKGVTKTTAEWARDKRVMVSHSTINRRLARGMSVEDARCSLRRRRTRGSRYDAI